MHIITIMIVLGVGILFCQDAPIIQCNPKGDAVARLGEIMKGARYEDIKQFIDSGAYVVNGRRRELLTTVLKGSNRSVFLNEDSSRKILWMDVKSNLTQDALHIVIKTVDHHNGDEHLHSFVLYSKPLLGWQIYHWHVGN